MVRPEKIAEVELLTEKMRESSALVLADFTGLSVAEVSDLRKQCREADVEFRVVKNRLAKRAASAAEFTVLQELLQGPTGIAFGGENAVEPAKVLVKFAETNDKVTIKGGLIDGDLIDAKGVEQLSKIPSREELLAMLLRGMQAPAQGFVGVLNGVMRQFVGTLDALAKKKGEEGA